MDGVDLVALLKLYGPQIIPWIALAYFGKWHLDRLDRYMDAQVKLATALESLTAIIKERIGAKNP